jgi:hypothetical protein
LLILQYYQLVRSVWRRRPDRRRGLTRCRHCGIFLLTDPRNAGRKDMHGVGRRDLGCPFGCREAHRRQASTRRSVAYYRTDQGRKRKQDLNQRRSAAGRGPASAPAPKAGDAPAPAACGPWPEPVVEHVRVGVSLIERRHVSRQEMLQMRARVLRQQGRGRRRRLEPTVVWLKEPPP